MGIKRYFEKLKTSLFSTKAVRLYVTTVLYIVIGFLVFVDIDVVGKAIMFASCIILLNIVYGMFTEIEKYNIQKEIPKAKKRFTKKLNDGRVVIEADKFQEAILFLYEIEEKTNM